MVFDMAEITARSVAQHSQDSCHRPAISTPKFSVLQSMDTQMANVEQKPPTFDVATQNIEL